MQLLGLIAGVLVAQAIAVALASVILSGVLSFIGQARDRQRPADAPQAAGGV